jgi:hypothetical protein
MNLNVTIKKMMNILMAMAGAFALVAALAPNARAGCGYPMFGAAITSPGSIALATSDARPASFSAIIPDNPEPEGAAPEGASIVGMWKAKLLVNGAVFDAGYTQWHGDGTEFTQSSFPPAAGNFCLGVWKIIGPSTYKLNHLALNFDPSTGALIGHAAIHEQVTVDRKSNTYSGTFDIDLFDILDHKIGHIEGTIAAERVTVN